MENHFLTVLEPRDPRSRYQQGLGLVRALFLGCRWLPSATSHGGERWTYQ